MLGDLANLLFAIAAVLAGLLAAALLVIGVWKPHLLKRGFRWRYKDFEAELHGAVAAATEEGTHSIAPTDGSAVQPPPSAEKPASIETSDESQSAYDLLITGRKYEEALEQLRRENAGVSESDERIESEALFYYFGFREGFTRAFGDLEKLAEANPSSFGAHFWRSRVLEEVGQPAQALTAVRKAYSLARTASERVTAVIQEADLLVVTGSSQLDAARVIGKELAATEGPADRGKIFKAIADLFKAMDPPDKPAVLMMLEAAVYYNPTDRDLLFEAAYQCGESSAEDLALFHYAHLLRIDPAHGTALNNAGVAAERLELPITGVRYYKRAEQEGESLASANLAFGLLKAGFIDEARSRLDEAREKFGNSVHSNVIRHIGTAAASETDEANKRKDINVGDVPIAVEI